MISLYKGLYAVYLSVAALCAAGAAVAVYFYPTQAISIVSIAIIIFGFTGIFIIRITREKFKNEVMSLLYNCRAQDFMDKVDELFKDKHSKAHKSTYAWLKALGYDVIGDFDAMYECCQNITKKSHMSEYHRRMITYYVEKDNIERAKDEIEKLKVLSSTTSGPDKIMIDRYIGEGTRAIKLKLHDVEDLDKFYEGESTDAGSVLLSLVSFAETYGQVLIIKGEKEKARKQLLFASENGGDTKYKKYADKLLAELD